ncbi:unnamed protein product [Rotaria socialis]|uniref:Rab-GAP TBC domain-containing protein n=1 Tax=Rotaria socialis TaxID=392032 RepID=A0A820BG35_9BILA|nr:unnamed protein product [Rotaria socialis]CAF3404198.1 unnamed protein product [Rotaria socialis]CAF3512211.1 unnamed protein product [Rotaria socialis]CAF3631545.1 unnamed protein product [Rotaria socialis]CAF3652408.1 unnamed protein product [Rotaria socialis]
MTDKVDEKLKQTFLNQTQKIIISTGKFVADFQSLLKTIKQSDQYEYYQHLFKSTQVASFDEHKYEIDYLKKGQSAWEKRIVKSLNTMCSEVNLPLARQRNENEMRSVRRHWNELGHICGDLNRFRPVYSAKDFLDVICVLMNPNLKIDESIWNCGLIKIPLVTKSFIEIKNLYSDLRPNLIQYCSDETFNEVKEEENIKLALQILEKKSNLNAAREYAKRGCPTSLRGKLWSSMLDVDLSNWHVTYFNYLKQNVIDYDLLVDSLYFKDVKLTAVNDDQLFVFEDYLYQVLLLFSRDTYVQSCFTSSASGCQPARSFIKKKIGAEECAVIYPPSGIIPFYGFSMLVAPMCFVFEDPVHLYFIFRQFYMKYFFDLHHISASPNAIVGLCVLFESLLRQISPDLWFHLQDIQVQPLRMAFKWMMRAFSGYLASNQLLALWDRILAYDSLEILSLLAVAIFVLRKGNVLTVTSESAVEAIFSDISSIKVIPLLQFILGH